VVTLMKKDAFIGKSKERALAIDVEFVAYCDLLTSRLHA
jgi:hypothetical protein